MREQYHDQICERCGKRYGQHVGDNCSTGGGLFVGRSSSPVIYKVTKHFNLIDIFNKKPCTDEYSKLMDERADEGYSIRHPFKTFKDIEESKVLMRNLPWLINFKFIYKDKFSNLDYKKPILASAPGGITLVLMPWIEKGQYDIKGYNWFALEKFKLTSCVCFETIDEALKSRSHYNFKNVEMSFTDK